MKTRTIVVALAATLTWLANTHAGDLNVVGNLNVASNLVANGMAVNMVSLGGTTGNYSLWLMFCPNYAFSIPIPITNATWGWSGTVKLINNVPTLTSASPQNAPKYQTITGEPTWIGNMTPTSP